MKTLFAITLAALSISLCSCSSDKKSEYSEKREQAEKEGQICLKEARSALSNKKYNDARTSIEKMRKDFPLALNAREEGILLLDSVNLFEAENQIKIVNQQLRDNNSNQDSLQIEFDDLFQKSKFYKRKLEHDKKERKMH